MVPDPQEWTEAHVKLAEKWDGRMGIGAGTGTWKQRARRAEADADAARLLAYMNLLELHGRALELERALAEATESISWRITAPFRRLGGRTPRAPEKAMTPGRVGPRLATTEAPGRPQVAERPPPSTMIAFGSSIQGAEAYRRYAEPGSVWPPSPTRRCSPTRPWSPWGGPTT